MLLFKDKAHEEVFHELLEQAELFKEQMIDTNELKRRQIAFLYLIALYQEDYKHYEGQAFWVEVYEDIELDGPTYLLEDAIDLSKYPHERMLAVAKQILEGKIPCLETIENALRCFPQQALKIINGEFGKNTNIINKS